MTYAIVTEGLGKRYVLGERRAAYGTLRDSVAHGARRVVRRGSIAPAPTRTEFWALQDLDVTVPQGRPVGIIGHNGAGKSTLLKILARITEPTTGRAVLRGRVGSLLEVGTGFHPELTGRENVFMNGSILGMARAEIDRHFDSIVDFAQVEHFIDTPVKHYSSGMQLRLAFSVASHLEPEILLVDEVLAVGDAAFQRRCMGKMGDVAGDGRTVVLVSHNLAAIENLCEEVIWLERGRLREQTTDVAGAIRRYLHEAYGEDGFGAGRPLVAEGLRGHLEVIDPASGLPATVLGIGEPVHLRLHLELEHDLPAPNVILEVNDAQGVLVSVFNVHRQDPEPFELRAGTSVVDCVTDELNLLPGDYRIAIQIRARSERIVVEPQAARLSVASSDFYGTGRPPIRGLVAARARWTVTERPAVEAHRAGTV